MIKSANVDEWRKLIRTTKTGGSEEFAYVILQNLRDYNLASRDEESTEADIVNLGRALRAWAAEEFWKQTLRERHEARVEEGKGDFEIW